MALLLYSQYVSNGTLGKVFKNKPLKILNKILKQFFE